MIAHRGASGYAPENTLAAFRKAAELGARFIETDLHVTRDLHFVAIHDATLERTTNGRGGVHEKTLAELRKLDAGSWFGSEFVGERIPTLDEIFEFSNETDVGFYLEMKTGPGLGVSHALVSALRRATDTNRLIVISFDSSILESVLRQEPSLMTGFLFDRRPREAVEQAQRLGVRQLLPRGDLVSHELVIRAHHADLQVVTWTVDAPADLRTVIAAGVDGVMSNYPDRLIAILKES